MNRAGRPLRFVVFAACTAMVAALFTLALNTIEPLSTSLSSLLGLKRTHEPLASACVASPEDDIYFVSCGGTF